MKTDFSNINRDEFFMRPCVVAGEACFLVEPVAAGVPKWDRHNLIYRSSLWDAQGNPVSLSFPKFFNWGEDIDAEGQPTGKIPYSKPKDLKGSRVLDKLDGSCLILSRYKGQTIVRTRGTVDAAATLSNGHEIAFLRAKYPKLFALFDNGPETMDYSLICEWFSPLNKIVLNYGDEPQLWLIGGIDHKDYSILSQEALDEIAAALEVPRPAYYSFDSIEEMRAAVTALEGKEGVCIYYQINGVWHILKDKSSRYLKLHYYKGDVATFDKVVDIWIELGQPSYSEFYHHLETKYDWEIAEYAKGHISKIADAAKKMKDIVDGMHNFIRVQLKGLSRKQQYEKATQSYGDTPRRSMVMTLLDGKPLKDDSVKKLILQNMK